MCSLCSMLLKSHWAELGSDRRERAERVRVLNRVLAYFSLDLADWSSHSYVLSDRKGKTILIADIGTLWAEAERLAGRTLDPLDEELVHSLETAHD